MTAPLPPDPADVTDADRVKASELLQFNGLADRYINPTELQVRDAIAAALAAERAAVARPVLALAEELETRAAWHRNHTGGELAARFTGQAMSEEETAIRLRSLAAALGETGGGR